MTFPAVSAGSAEAKMLHLLSFLFFLGVFASVALLIVGELRGSAERITAVLTGVSGPIVCRQWPARVRLVAAPHLVVTGGVRSQVRRAIA